MNCQVPSVGPSWTSIVPIIAGSFTLGGALVVAFVQWRLFKKQVRSAHALRMAEMKQAWLNDLRDAMATLQSYGVTPNLDHAGHREFYEHGTKIELLMNPDDKNYKELEDCLYMFLAAVTKEEKFSVNAKYVNVCQIILKAEWETLKREIADAR